MMVRFGVSVEESLLARFDRLVKGKGYANRSEALRDLMRAQLIAEEWRAGAEVVGAIVLV
ncbi:MAG: ribbon-helix-helix protein, CopG family, partial [Firmicutes bacterium]|nr:ribbon-helix-helix protein, CopG family [Bacillota bacterium]